MKILISGVNGFVGSSLLGKIPAEYTIVGQGRGIEKTKSNLKKFFDIDINSQSIWAPCLHGVEVVVHLAAVAHNNSDNIDYMYEVNVNGTINLVQQAIQSGVKRFIFISSIGVLGNGTKPGKAFDELSPVVPHSQYAQSKLDAENALLKIAKESKMEVVIIRPVLVYGASAPGNFGKLVNLVNKVPMLPFALCNNKRSFISVSNLVDFILVCITHPKAANEVFCISDGIDISIRELTDGIAKGLNKNLVQLPIPVFIFKLVGKIAGKSELIEQLIGDLQVDSTKARILLDWEPPVTMVETFSKLTINN
ncbi:MULTISPECIES: NAD-dependent epimerase/dehydratase family protein [unclassified Shewanella]|uniref:NAD-dependent epimerase/dehydratase family protein n=1 Tax=unclassified Shewanella TaxID=196818 RepID=UPI0021D93E62|nr:MULTISPECIES: NAD-dependent epimerase/dehydratase family protein [unclassified Shewanella]MCU8022004.1 NAD-dependent epimerase/dehydratase family protein [Shewanella sp. SM78]MCU8079294.1 NAD-dependent epimerase/dehydratase family protein [Shewanella sp. SM103]